MQNNEWVNHEAGGQKRLDWNEREGKEYLNPKELFIYPVKGEVQVQLTLLLHEEREKGHLLLNSFKLYTEREFCTWEPLTAVIFQSAQRWSCYLFLSKASKLFISSMIFKYGEWNGGFLCPGIIEKI